MNLHVNNIYYYKKYRVKEGNILNKTGFENVGGFLYDLAMKTKAHTKYFILLKHFFKDI